VDNGLQVDGCEIQKGSHFLDEPIEFSLLPFSVQTHSPFQNVVVKVGITQRPRQ
jgi:hypothetical protein